MGRDSISTTSPWTVWSVPSASCGDGPQVGEVFVGAREVEEQVADGGEAEPGEQIPPRRRDAGQLVEREGDGLGVH